MENETLYKYLKGETSVAEDAEIAAWYEADPKRHRRRLDSMRMLFEGMELHGGQPRAKRAGMCMTWRRICFAGMRVAAVVLLALGAGRVSYRYAFDVMSGQTNTLKVPAGQRMELMLADGTHVWLNSEAELEFPAVFAPAARRIRLSGEAMFDVKPDAARPFTVETFASDVQVLGTKFNINADEEHGRFSTALLNGSVRVSNRIDPSQADIVMKPDEVVALVDGKMVISQLDDDTELCWMNGMLCVTGLSFTELMDRFEQVFAVHVIIDRESLPDMQSVGGKIRVDGGIRNALRMLQYSEDFDYEIDEATNTVTIR